MSSFSPVDSWSVLGGMNLAWHMEHGKLRAQGAHSTKRSLKRAKKAAAAAATSHTEAADESASLHPTSLLRLEAVLKSCQAFCGHPTHLEAPPGILLPVGFDTPPPLAAPDACHPALPPDLLLPVGFTAPLGLALPGGCHPGSPPGLLLPNEEVSGSDDLIEADAEDTSVSTGSIKVFGDSDPEETASEAKGGFPMKVDALCFRSTPLSPVLTNSVCRFDKGRPRRLPRRRSHKFLDLWQAPTSSVTFGKHLLPKSGAQSTPPDRMSMDPDAAIDTRSMKNITTLVIRNLPRSLTQQELVQAMGESGYAGTWDFCYLPQSFQVRKNFGFAFVNFASADLAQEFKKGWHQTRPFTFGRVAKPVNVAAAAVQGREANEQKAHLLMGQVKNLAYQPVLL